jgi:hypothetical protein
MMQVSPRLPRLSLTFGCGCRQRLIRLLDAVEHANDSGHIVTITGTLGLRGHGLDPSLLVNSGQLQSLCLSFGCGCGLNTHSLEKAIEHLVKSSHTILFRGTVHPGKKVRASRARAYCRRVATLYTVEALEKVLGSEEDRHLGEDRSGGGRRK